MKWTFIKNKAFIILAHIVMVVAVLASVELLAEIVLSQWIILLGLGFLLVCYFVFYTKKLEYIPLFHIGVAFCSFWVWIAVLCTCHHWTHLTGFDGLYYFVYPFFLGIFLLLLLIVNLVVYISRRVQEKIRQM